MTDHELDQLRTHADYLRRQGRGELGDLLGRCIEAATGKVVDVGTHGAKLALAASELATWAKAYIDGAGVSEVVGVHLADEVNARLADIFAAGWELTRP